MKQRKKQLLAFLLSIIFVVSSFAGSVKAEARGYYPIKGIEENYFEIYALQYPNSDFYNTGGMFNATYIESEDSKITIGKYEDVWTVPSEGMGSGKDAWLIDGTGGVKWNHPSFRPTDKKIKLSKKTIKKDEDINITVDASDFFDDTVDVTYQWYVYDEKPLALNFEESEFWNTPSLVNGKYYFTNKDSTVPRGDTYAVINGSVASQILPGYDVHLANVDTRGYASEYASYLLASYAMPLTIDSGNTFSSGYPTTVFLNQSSDDEIVPSGLFETSIYGIQLYDKKIEGATGKTLVLSKDSPFYDLTKQYYCKVTTVEYFLDVAYDTEYLIGYIYPSQAVSIELAGSDIDLSKCSVTVNDQSYTGKKLEPAVTVKNGNVAVDKSKYTVTYKNNTNVGTATVTVTAKTGSGFTGSKSAKFKITKAKNAIKVNDSIEKAVSSKDQSFNLNAKASFGSLTYKSNNKNVTVSKTGKVTIARNFIGAAKITIDVKGTSNYIAASKTVNISVNPSKISVAKLTNPSKGAIKVSWKANEKLSGYEIQYTNDSKFKKTVKTVKINKATVNEKEIKNLKKGKTYYVRIRAYKTISGKKYYSDWSAAKSIKIKK
ncbi:MAG: fibronectin type III domain-containing protein [Lachnospiraceae bacterium]|nr:fibronectin type III domain-containing protein [Lachnospiraceae bacterium]